MFPHIVVQFSKANYNFEAGQAEVRIMIGCWDDADDRSRVSGCR